MDRARKFFDGWDLASYPIARAFALSLLFHLLLFIVIESGHRAGLWKQTLLPAHLLRAQDLTPTSPLRPKTQKTEENPILFVDTDPAQESATPPKATQFYSSQNTLAA